MNEWKLRYKNLGKAKRCARYASTQMLLQSQSLTDVDIFNMLYSAVLKGSKLWTTSKGEWFFESKDGEKFYLDKNRMKKFYEKASPQVKETLMISKRNLFQADFYVELIKTYKDFPKKGVNFIDLNPVLANRAAFNRLISDLVEIIEKSGFKFNKIIGVESRGFYYALPLAERLGVGFVPVRKANKLPGDLIQMNYTTEYSTDSLFLQEAAIKQDDKILVVDDVLATGGTLNSILNTLYSRVEEVQALTVIELEALKGRKMINHPLHTLLSM